MKQSRFTEAQTFGILMEQECVSPAAAVCRMHRISADQRRVALHHDPENQCRTAFSKASTDGSETNC